MKYILNLIVLTLVVATPALAQEGSMRGTFTISRVTAINTKLVAHVATLRALIAQPAPADVASSPVLLATWNKQTQAIAALNVDLLGLSAKYETILQDDRVTSTEGDAARVALSDLQQSPESDERKAGLNCKAGNKYTDAICGRNRIATDIWWWVLSGCPND